MRVQGVVHPLGREHNAAFQVCACNTGISLLSFSVASSRVHSALSQNTVNTLGSMFNG